TKNYSAFELFATDDRCSSGFQTEHGATQIPSHLAAREVKWFARGHDPTEKLVGECEVRTQIGLADKVFAAINARDRTRDGGQRRPSIRPESMRGEAWSVHCAVHQPIPPCADTRLGALKCDNLIFELIN